MWFSSINVLLAFTSATIISKALARGSPAFIWHRSGERGEPVTDQTLPLIENDHSILFMQSTTSIGNNNLTLDKDYSIFGPNITFKSSYLSTFFDPNGTWGVKANIKLHYSDATDDHVQAVQWDTPQPGTTDFIVKENNADEDLRIAMDFRGLNKMAGITARMINGTYLICDDDDDALEGHLEYSKYWDYDAEHVVIKPSVLRAVLEANITTGLTFEFYPRIHANTVNFTIGLIDP